MVSHTKIISYPLDKINSTAANTAGLPTIKSTLCTLATIGPQIHVIMQTTNHT